MNEYEIKPEDNESKLHSDAMLYLLDDPSLDRKAFEIQLAEDAGLAEILAETVAVYHSLRRVQTWQPLPVLKDVMIVSLRSSPNPVVWRWFAVVAATLLITGFLGRNSLNSIRSGADEVALAWGEMKFESPDSSAMRDASESEFDAALSLSAMDSLAVGDVPEWLVLATADTLEGTLESQEGRALIQ